MKQYPPQKDTKRLANYEKYEKLFFGEHKTVFQKQLEQYGEQFLGHTPLRYLALNYPRMISTISADMLFEEKPSIKTELNDEFVEGLFQNNSLWVKFYELALATSYKGDGVMRIRNDKNQVKIDVVKPDIYFVDYEDSNTNNKAEKHILAYIVEIEGMGNDEQGILVEEYGVGYIETKLYHYKDNMIGNQLDLSLYNSELQEIVNTNLNDDYSLIHHIKNYGVSGKYWGISDYMDLEDLFFAINNRFSKNESILDKHSDPILAVPEGVIDEKGETRRQDLGMVEINSGPNSDKFNVPQYITWNAGLEASFSQIDSLLEQLWIISQTSPSLFGINKYGVAESGRALKYKLLRTLALKHRKQLYWDDGIKNILESAMAFAMANNLNTKGIISKSIETPTIQWQDGIIQEELEAIEAEEKKLANELTTREDAIARIDGISQNEAQDKLVRIQEELTEKAKNNPFNFGATEL
jgi:hypothetical protein